MDTKTCLYCKVSFQPERRSRLYCSKSCAGRGVGTFDIRQVASQGGRALKGRPQSPEHIARRAESMRNTLASTRRVCGECGAEFTPTTAPQRHCSGRCSEAVRSRRAYGTRTTAQRQAARNRITSEEREGLMELQGGLCAICKSLSDERSLCADHCHTTGRVRGLLCHRCNTAIGLLNDNPETLEAAIEYLRQSVQK